MADYKYQTGPQFVELRETHCLFLHIPRQTDRRTDGQTTSHGNTDSLSMTSLHQCWKNCNKLQ